MTAAVEEQAIEPPSPYSLAILVALQRKHVYAGTVPHAVKRSRRIKARVAKATRKGQRP